MKPLIPRPALLAMVCLIPGLPLQADMTVTGSGAVTVTNTAAIHFAGGTLQIKDNAQVRVHGGGNLTGSTVEVGPTGKLVNCGTVNAAVVNQGEVVADCGGTSVFLSSVTNSGVFRVSHGSSLMVAGAFQNNPGALLDLITATQNGPPAAFSNAGTLIEAKDVRVAEIVAGPVDVKIMIQGIPPHTYRLVGSSTLPATIWNPIGPVKIATGGMLQLDHPGVVLDFEKYFYKVLVSDQ